MGKNGRTERSGCQFEGRGCREEEERKRRNGRIKKRGAQRKLRSERRGGEDKRPILDDLVKSSHPRAAIPPLSRFSVEPAVK